MPEWKAAEPIPSDRMTGERAPKRPRVASVPRPSTRSLKAEIAAQLVMINFVLVMIPPLRQDQLDPVEIEALASSIDDQCKKSPRFRKAVEGALMAGSGAGLIGILAIIGARRAARHGYIPAEADQMLGNLLATGQAVEVKRDAAAAA